MSSAPRRGLRALLIATARLAAGAPAAGAKAPKPKSLAVAYVGQKLAGGITITKLDRLLATQHGGVAFTAVLSGNRYGIFWSVVLKGKRTLRRLVTYPFPAGSFYPEVQRLLAADQTGGLLAFSLRCHIYLAKRQGQTALVDLGDACYKQEATYPKRTVNPEGLGYDFDVDISGRVYFPARDTTDPGPPQQPQSLALVDTLDEDSPIPAGFANSNGDSYVEVGPNGRVFLTDHRSLFEVKGGGDPVQILGPGTAFTFPNPGTISTYHFGDDGAIVCAFDGPRFFHYPGNPRFVTSHINSTRGVECGDSPDLVAVALAGFGGPHNRFDKITNKTRKGALKEGERVQFGKSVYKVTNLYSDRFSSPFAYDGTIAYHGLVNNRKRTEAFMVRQP